MKKFNLSVLFVSASLVFVGCNQSTESKPDVVVPEASSISAETSTLEQVLQAQPEEVIARYDSRHPKETLDFFGVKPGMTVMEGLPGGGWYTKILMPYLGNEGKIIGTDYAADMFPLFGFFSDERLEAKKTWVATWTAEAQSWRDEGSTRESS